MHFEHFHPHYYNASVSGNIQNNYGSFCLFASLLACFKLFLKFSQHCYCFLQFSAFPPPPQLLQVDVGLICTSYNEDARSTSLPLGSAQNILTQSKLFHVRKQKLVVVCESSSLLKLLYFLITQNYRITISGNKYCLFSNSVSFTQKQALTPG